MMDRYFHHLDRRKLTLISVATLVLLTAALASYLVVPDVKDFRRMQDSFALLQSAANDGTELANRIGNMEQSVAGLQKQLHGDMAKLPIQQMEAYIVGRLQAISWDNNVELVSVEPSAGGRVEEFVEILFRVKLNGAYFDLYAWVQEVANDLGFVVIKEYEMVPLDRTVEEPNLSVSLTMASYRAGES